MVKCHTCKDTGLISEKDLPGLEGSRFCTFCDQGRKLAMEEAVKIYPNHHPETALANYRAGREVWDTNGDVW